MARKNLLGSTDYITGWDNRYGTSVHLGLVSKIEVTEEHADVRVIMPDKVDHKGTPLNTKPIPVLQVASKAKRQFAVPRIGDMVAIMKMPNSTSSYFVIGSFYTKKNPPPVTDPMLDYTEWEGGHTQKFDANEDAEVFLTQDFKGGWNATVKKDINIKTTDAAKINIEGDGDVLVKSTTGNVTIDSPTGTVLVKQDIIELQATTEIKLTAPIITVIGDMNQTGVHLDSKGYHGASSARREEDLLARIEKLESRVSLLEAALIAKVGEVKS